MALTQADIAQKIADDCGTLRQTVSMITKVVPMSAEEKDANCKAPENDSARFSFLCRHPYSLLFFFRVCVFRSREAMSVLLNGGQGIGLPEKQSEICFSRKGI